MKSVDASGVMRYRLDHDDKTLMCPIGEMIDSDLYNESFEGKSSRVIMYMNEDLKSMMIQMNLDLIEHLQAAHDSSNTLDDLKEGLHKTADSFSLDPSLVNDITSFEIPKFN